MTLVDLVEESAIHVRVRTGWAIGRSDDGASFIAVSEDGPGPPLGRYKRGYETANARLGAGAPLADLRDTVLGDSGAHSAAAYLLWLQRLCDWGLVEFPLVDEAGECAVIAPQWYRFLPVLAPEAPRSPLRLDRFACLRREGDSWLLESPLVGARFQLPDLAALEAPLVRRALGASGFLESEIPETDLRRDALEQWEFHDLIFHVHNRAGMHRDPLGAMFPYIGETEPPPALRPPWPGERIALPRAPEGGEPFASVLERRRSERFCDDDHPISLDDLGALLDRAARIRSSQVLQIQNAKGRQGTFEITQRPYPNGGASYELEIYPIVDRCDGLEAGLYHYDAGTHELVRLSGRTPEIGLAIKEASIATVGLASPQVVLAIAARFSRVMWKYKAISYGTILRNTGALYQTLYLAATELGLSPCGMGSGNSGLFALMTGLDPVVEGTVGDFIVSGRPRRS